MSKDVFGLLLLVFIALVPFCLMLIDDRRITRRLEHKHLAALAERADAQHNALMSGDLTAGIHGAYPPVSLEDIPAVEALRHQLDHIEFGQAIREENERLRRLDAVEQAAARLKGTP